MERFVQFLSSYKLVDSYQNSTKCRVGRAGLLNIIRFSNPSNNLLISGGRTDMDLTVDCQLTMIVTGWERSERVTTIHPVNTVICYNLNAKLPWCQYLVSPPHSHTDQGLMEKSWMMNYLFIQIFAWVFLLYVFTSSEHPFNGRNAVTMKHFCTFW